MLQKSLVSLAVILACAPSYPTRAAKPEKRAASSTRWYGAEPHTPLAVVDGRGLRAAGQAACAPWSKLGSRWRAVDAYGQVVGTAELSARDRYDVTRCEEVELRQVEGAPGVGLFASVGGAWRAPTSARWTPSDAQRTKLFSLIAELRAAVAPDDHASDTPPVLFFRAPVGAGGPVEQAVIGGRLLIIARLDTSGRWRLVYFDNQAATGEMPADAFRPLAVFDMDGDGRPEVVYHLNFGDSWSDVVLGSDGAGVWRPLAESVHGATA